MFKYSTLLLVFLFIACEERKVLRQEAGSAESVSAKGKAATESKSGRVRSSERPETNTLLSLKEEIEVMVPADFDRLWTAVGELDASPAQKQFLLENCLLAKCSVGGAQEAIEAVMNTFGPGDRRNVLISTIASHGGLSLVDLCKLEASFADKELKDAVHVGIVSTIAATNNLEALPLEMIAKLASGGRDTLLDGLLLNVKGVAGGHEIEVRLSEILKWGADSSKQVGSTFSKDLILKLAHEFPMEVWKISSADSSIRNDSVLIAQICSEMARRDPAKAMAAAYSTSNAAGAGNAFSAWLKLDPKEASQWFDARKSELPLEIKDNIYSAQAKFDLAEGNGASARNNAEGISDEKLRSEIISRVWNFERDALRTAVGVDPIGTLQDIVSGQSKYGEYWIEEAMGTWITKDFDKAQSWYQNNWSKLPANKSQFIAAAFANQATDQGDTATARQWAAHIQDAKTKQRIEAGIAKAEAAKNN